MSIFYLLNETKRQTIKLPDDVTRAIGVRPGETLTRRELQLRIWEAEGRAILREADQLNAH